MIATVSYDTRRLPVDEIVSLAGRRSVDEKVVEKLAESITRLGLQIPITVRMVDDHADGDTGEVGRAYVLVTGAHRLAAFRKLGEDYIPAVVRDCDEVEARLWEIAENLHRAELTALQRDEHIARWIGLTKTKRQGSSQLSTNQDHEQPAPDAVSRQPDAKPGRPEGGVRAAARELGLSEPDARRAVKVASLSEEAKQAAVDAGLDDNRSALLAAAKESGPEKQVEVIQARAILPAAASSAADMDARLKARDEREKVELAVFLARVEAIEPLLAEIEADDEIPAHDSLTYMQVAERYKPIMALRAYRWRVGYGKAAGDASRRIECARDTVIDVLTGTAQDELEKAVADSIPAPANALTTDTFDGAPIPRTPMVDLDAA